jgi:hypothetical protein
LPDSLRLIGINDKAALNVAQGTAADVLINRQVKHPVDQTFAQCAASQSHTLNVQLGENGDQNGKPAWENQRTFECQTFNFQLFQTTTLDGTLF